MVSPDKRILQIRLGQRLKRLCQAGEFALPIILLEKVKPLFAELEKRQLEGMVAKRAIVLLERTRAWLKIKNEPR
jgi:ATP-dependent DNA ligase